MPPLKNFLGGSYESQSPIADQELTINLYLERLESPGATAKMALYPTPGVEELSSTPVGPGFGHFYNSGREFAVINNKLFEIDQPGIMTERGTVAVGTTPATISSNGDGGGQLFITAGGNGYCYDLGTNTLTQVAALNGKAVFGAHLDGYFLALDTATSTFYISNLLDGLTWDTGVDFAQRSIAPDPWVAMIVTNRFVWLLGTQTSEIWYNTGASFPFAAHPSGLIPYGILAPFSVAIAGTDLIWLGSASTGGAQVLRATAFTPERISSYPLETVIGNYSIVADAVADTYQEAGHTFYLLTFPVQDVTFCWDKETTTWTQRGTWVPEENKFKAMRPRFHASAFNQHRMLDSVTGSVYRMSTEFGLDVDEMPIRRIRRAPAIVNGNKRIFYHSFELDMEVGLGTSTGQGEDPQVMMRMSNDGGKTWGSERMRSAGKQGEYGTRVMWERLGSARRRVYEVSISDPIPFRLMGAWIEAEEGAA